VKTADVLPFTPATTSNVGPFEFRGRCLRFHGERPFYMTADYSRDLRAQLRDMRDHPWKYPMQQQE